LMSLSLASLFSRLSFSTSDPSSDRSRDGFRDAGHSTVLSSESDPEALPSDSLISTRISTDVEKQVALINQDVEKKVASEITDYILMSCCSCFYYIVAFMLATSILLVSLTWTLIDHNDCPIEAPDLFYQTRAFGLVELVALIVEIVWCKFAYGECPFISDIYSIEQALIIRADRHNLKYHRDSQSPQRTDTL